MTAPVSTLDIVAADLVPYRVLHLPAGVMSPHYPAEYVDKNEAHARVEFYDRRYNFTPDGQFTGGRFYVRDIIDRHEGRPLQIDRDWLIDADAMMVVRSWLRHLASRPPRFRF